MKRTLVEIGCGIAAVAAMVGFHSQVARLQLSVREIDDLRSQLELAVANTTKKAEIDELLQVREQLLGELELRMQELDGQLQHASRGTEMARALQQQLERDRAELAQLRSEYRSTSERTRAMVDAYIDEVRVKELEASQRIQKTQQDVAQIAEAVMPDARQLTNTMLLPTVQLNGADTVGSGTLVFSGTNPKTAKVESWVLTANHVVRNILADTPKAEAEGFDVTIYLPEGNVVTKGQLVTGNSRIDSALVRLEGDRVYPYVALAQPEQKGERVRVWDPVCAVGCPLGNDPVPSHGQVSSLTNELNGSNYWMITAPTYFGNSGGGVYHATSRKLIGVFSKIYTHGKGNPVVIPHMGLCTPIDTVRDWLRGEGLDHLLGSEAKVAAEATAVQVTKGD